jgi:hypothetical protein
LNCGMSRRMAPTPNLYEHAYSPPMLPLRKLT